MQLTCGDMPLFQVINERRTRHELDGEADDGGAVEERVTLGADYLIFHVHPVDLLALICNTYPKRSLKVANVDSSRDCSSQLESTSTAGPGHFFIPGRLTIAS